jgi:hypothetical protein
VPGGSWHYVVVHLSTYAETLLVAAAAAAERVVLSQLSMEAWRIGCNSATGQVVPAWLGVRQGICH